MSGSASSDVFADVVTRLRAAGCVFAEDEARLLVSAASTPDELGRMVEQRRTGQPLEHVLGWAEFCGLRVAVDPGVFVPRRRTELLVRESVARLKQATPRGARAVVVDLCCGSGAVAVAIAAACGRVDLYAVDIEPASVACARRNLPAASKIYEGDLYAPLPIELRGRVDVVVANAPYVPSDAVRLLPPEARLHEPRLALDGGADGLELMRRVTSDAPQWLARSGCLLVETSEGQASAALKAMARSGLTGQVTVCADLDATVVIGTVAEDVVGRPR